MRKIRTPRMKTMEEPALRQASIPKITPTNYQLTYRKGYSHIQQNTSFQQPGSYYPRKKPHSVEIARRSHVFSSKGGTRPVTQSQIDLKPQTFSALSRSRKTKATKDQQSQAFKTQKTDNFELKEQVVLAVPGNRHINDPNLKITSFDVSKYRMQMLPNKQAILANSSLRYLSMEQRAKLVQAPQNLVKQVFASLIENLNIDITSSFRNRDSLNLLRTKSEKLGKVLEFTGIYRVNGEQVKCLDDIPSDCKIVLLGQQIESNPPRLLGVEEYMKQIPIMKCQAIQDLFRKKQKEWAIKIADIDQDEISSPTPSDMFNPGFELTQDTFISQEIICQILLQKQRASQKNQKSPRLRQASLKKGLNFPQNRPMIVSGQKVTVGKVTFMKGDQQSLHDSINNVAEQISKVILDNRYPRQGFIERRGLLSPGKFKLQAGREASPIKNERLVTELNSESKQDSSKEKKAGTKRSVLKKSSNLLASDQPSLTFRTMRDVCKKFNISRKDAYNIRSEFFSLLRMHESIKGSRKSSMLQEDDTSLDSTGRTQPGANIHETVPLDFLVDNLPFFKFMLKPTIYRVLRAIGFDTANPKFKVGLEHYMELYCVLVLGNLDIRMEAAFWVKFFDPSGLGVMDRQQFFNCVEQLVRGNVIRAREAATEEYAAAFEKELKEKGCYDEKGEKVKMDSLRSLLVNGDVDVGILTNMLTGKIAEEGA